MKEQYVILTGSKNNAGDHLIKYRAKKLLQWLKPNIDVIDYNGWEKLSDNQLEVINDSKALILTGGPALQKNMYPGVYALRDNLDDIKAPVTTMGIGWYDSKGNWDNTHNYKLDNFSLKLLDKIEKSRLLGSVRDYHTLNALNSLGYKNYLMTGCPALYEKDFIKNPIIIPNKIEKIAFSLGVSMKTSKRMFEQMKIVLLTLKNLFPIANVEVVFHHSPTQEYLNAHGSNKKLYIAQNRYLDWLKENSFNYIDISGSATKLVKYYSTVDLHFGYRVHAHIFMSSLSKPSVLFSEDGRGKALERVMGGIIIDAYRKVTNNILIKILHKLSIPIDNFSPNFNLDSDIENIINYELKYGIKLEQPKVEIQRHFKVMKKFIEQLP